MDESERSYPSSSQLRTEEMEDEARDAMHTEFTVTGRCISCLETREINPDHLCEKCEDLNDSSGGTLLPLLLGGSE